MPDDEFQECEINNPNQEGNQEEVQQMIGSFLAQSADMNHVTDLKTFLPHVYPQQHDIK